MRKVICLLLMVLLLLAVPLTVFAAADPVTDNAGLLTDEQEYDLTVLLLEQGVGTLCVVTEESLNGEDVEDYAEAWAENTGVGVVFMIAMEERQWCITAAPEYEPVINGPVIERIAAQCVPHLQSGNYYEAFVAFAEHCADYLDGFEPDQPQGNSYPQAKGSGIFRRILICLVIGLVAGGITIAIMASLNKSVRPKNSAADYVRSGSMQLRTGRDIYLYHHITRTPRSQNNSSSRGGGSRSTRSGSF